VRLLFTPCKALDCSPSKELRAGGDGCDGACRVLVALQMCLGSAAEVVIVALYWLH
jgi:hypothetical protein